MKSYIVPTRSPLMFLSNPKAVLAERWSCSEETELSSMSPEPAGAMSSSGDSLSWIASESLTSTA